MQVIFFAYFFKYVDSRVCVSCRGPGARSLFLFPTCNSFPGSMYLRSWDAWDQFTGVCICLLVGLLACLIPCLLRSSLVDAGCNWPRRGQKSESDDRRNCSTIWRANVSWSSRVGLWKAPLQIFFLKSWYLQNTSKWWFLVGKPMVVGYHHFRKPPIYKYRLGGLKTTFQHFCLADFNSSEALHEPSAS